MNDCDLCETHAGKVHRFPKNPDRATEWLESLQWDGKTAKAKQLSTLFICSGHFVSACYKNGKNDQALIHGAVPTIRYPRIPVPSSDHNYFMGENSHLPNDKFSTMDIDNGQEAAVEEAPFPKKFCSHDSQRTDITWNSRVTAATQFSHGELFTDMETVLERNTRRREESASIMASGQNYSLLAHSSLLELLDFVPGCLKCRNLAAKRTFRTVGTALLMNTDCQNCQKWTWCSSKKVHDDKLGGLMESNMDMTIATYICGIPYERMEDLCKTMKLGIPRKSTYYNIIKNHVKPSVDTMYEEDMADTRERIWNANRTPNTVSRTEKVPLSIIGDAQFDSRGFSASVCRYITMDYNTRLILDFEVQIRKENNGNSPIMESKAFARIMERLTNDDNFTISRVTTDKNASVIAHIHKNYPNIQHCLDKWHVLKLVKKHYLAVVERKKNSHLRVHWEHLLVHIWVSIEVANGNADFAVELIRSAEYHLQNVHNLPKDQFKLIQHCMHAPLQDDPLNPREFLDPTKHQSQIAVLHELLNNSNFLDNVRRCAARETTSPCESFHSLAAVIYLKKNISYDKQSTTTLTKLCAMHHNGHRKEIMDRESQGVAPATRKKYSRAQKRVREVIHQAKPSLIWKVHLMRQTKDHYFKSKEFRVANRTMGRPTKSLTTSSVSSSDESSSDDDDDAVDVAHPVDEPEPESDEDYTTELDSEDLPAPNPTCSLVYQPATAKPVIRVSPRQYDKVYAAMGADADNYIYIHNRTGERILE